MLDVPLNWLLEPVTIFDASLVVELDGLFFNVDAHWDFWVNMVSMAACLVFMAPISKANGDDVEVVEVVLVVGFRADA